jgi:hypothetical protein
MIDNYYLIYSNIIQYRMSCNMTEIINLLMVNFIVVISCNLIEYKIDYIEYILPLVS